MLQNWFHELIIYFQGIKELQIRVGGKSPSKSIENVCCMVSPLATREEWRMTSLRLEIWAIQEKNRNPMRFDGKGIVTDSVLKILRARDQGWSHLLLAQQRETSLHRE